jgi:hypothetical protein
MHIYQEIYEFAASAGAFEGYVYRRPEAEIDFKALSNWVDNLLDAYRHLAPDVLSEFQSAIHCFRARPGARGYWQARENDCRRIAGFCG